MKMIVMLGLVTLLMASCGGDNSPQAASSDPHSSPEAIFAAYSAATDAGDEAALRKTVRPSQQSMVSGATGVDGDSTYTVEKRVDVSADEVHLHVRFSPPSHVGDIALPHIIVREGGKWYVDIERTSMAMIDAAMAD